LQLLQRIGIPYPNPPAATYNNNDVDHPFMTKSYGQPGLQASNEECMPPFVPRHDILRPPSNFSPFSPDPSNLYTSSESMKRDHLNPFLRFDAFPHPSKAFAPGFFSQPQDMKINTSVNVAESKLSPSTVRPSSATRFTFAESTDPFAMLDGGHGRAGVPISRPNSGLWVPPTKKRDSDPIHDLNGTLASLDLERPWRSPEAKGKPFI